MLTALICVFMFVTNRTSGFKFAAKIGLYSPPGISLGKTVGSATMNDAKVRISYAFHNRTGASGGTVDNIGLSGQLLMRMEMYSLILGIQGIGAGTQRTGVYADA